MNQVKGNVEDPKFDALHRRPVSLSKCNAVTSSGHDTGFSKSPYKPICRKRYLL